MKLILAVIFFSIAALYASVGFGGGSSYTAVLAVSGPSYALIPIVSLICNICVVAGSSVRYARAKLLKLTDIWPFFILSVPCAWLGGTMHISETVFVGLLWIALLLGGFRLLLSGSTQEAGPGTMGVSVLMRSAIGGAIGLYSGLVGIGGGILLAPILYRLRWGSSLKIAALCSVFIFINSCFGLAGHLSKAGQGFVINDVLSYWPLVAAVIVGGTIGNRLGLKFFTETLLRRVTGVLIVAVAIRLCLKWLGLMGVG